MNGQRVLIDTSAWIEALRESGDAPIREKVDSLLDLDQAVLCDLVLLELWNGARGTKEKRHLRVLEATLPIVETSGEVWKTAFRVAEQTRSSGMTIPATDILIFSVARIHHLELCHYDRHFDELTSLKNGGSPPSK